MRRAISTEYSATRTEWFFEYGSRESMEFTTNYNLADFITLKALEGTEYDLAVWFGGTGSGSTVTPTGSDGKFEFKGKLTISVSGGGVNEVVDMTITVTPSTPITQTATVA